MFRKLFFFGSFLMQCHIPVFGQNNDKLNPGNAIYLNVSELMAKDIVVGYESQSRRYLRNAWIMEVGYKFPYKFLIPINTEFPSVFLNGFAYSYSKSIYASLGTKWVALRSTSKRFRRNFCFTGFYRYTFYDKINLSYAPSPADEERYWKTTQSKYQHTIGLKFQFAGRIKNSKSLLRGFYFDWFFGFGVRCSITNDYTYSLIGKPEGDNQFNITNETYSPPIKISSVYVIPSLHAGIRVGYFWEGKNKSQN